jgi:hypothetical protein
VRVNPAIRPLSIVLAFLCSCSAGRLYYVGGEYVSADAREAQAIETLEERSLAVKGDHRSCVYWSRARAEPGTPVVEKYIRERRTKVCRDDPALRFQGDVAAREAAIKVATAGYVAEGAPFRIEARAPVKVVLERGRCYVVVVRFPDGFAPEQRVDLSLDVKGPWGGGHFDSGPGPGGILGAPCQTESREGAVVLDAAPGTKAEAQLFTKTLSEQEIANEVDKRQTLEREAHESYLRSRRELVAACEYCGRETGCDPHAVVPLSLCQKRLEHCLRGQGLTAPTPTTCEER